MIIGTPRHKATLAKRYDTIVIGSGMSGLATAACLSKAGQKVLVLEQHYTAGGFTHTYTRKGYEWDVGLHYIGEVHRPNSTIRRIFDYISDSGLQWAQMDEVYDRIYLGDESFDLVTGVERFRAKMLSYFPQEQQALDRYLQLIRDVNASSSMFFLHKALPNSLAKMLRLPLCHRYLKFAEQTTADVLLTLTKNAKFIAVLTGQWGDYGLPPKSSSFAMHAMVVKHYLNGASYPVGGSASIARTIEPVIQKSGGQIVTRAAVDEIIVEHNKAVGVRLQGGQEIRAKTIISSVGVENTLGRLLAQATIEKHGLKRQLANIEPSMAHVGVYIGLQASDKELGLATSNLWLYPDEHHDANLAAMKQPGHKFPVIFISFPSSKDPEWDAKFPGKSTIEIVAPAPYEWFKQWQGSRWQKRGKDYTKFKQELQDTLLESLYRIHPQLIGRIHFAELSTPLSTEHFCRYKTGEIYGINHTPRRFQQKWLRPATPITNLYLTGQDIVTCGVGGALISGVLTTIRVLGLWRSRLLLTMLKPKRSR